MGEESLPPVDIPPGADEQTDQIRIEQSRGIDKINIQLEYERYMETFKNTVPENYGAAMSFEEFKKYTEILMSLPDVDTDL